MSKELFALNGLLQRNKEFFESKTTGHAFIVSEDAYNLFLKDSGHRLENITVVSESLYKKHYKPGDWPYLEIDDLTIVAEFQTAISIASRDRRNVTVLGGPDLIQEVVRIRRVVDRMYLIEVYGTFKCEMEFPFPMIDFFDLTDDDEWPADAQNPCRAHLYRYWRK